MLLRNITIGSDPEFGVIDLVSGEPRSVIGMLGGTKKEPLALGNGCFRQEDNVGAELTIPPCRTKEEFYKYITEGRDGIDRILSEHWLATKAVSSLRYSLEELLDPKAMEFGCEPAFDVYNQCEANRPTPEEVGNLRSFGAHIHIGWEGPKDFEILETLVKICDLFLGVPSVLIDRDQDRRTIYGGPGEFRICDYGIEYRTLGGYMLSSKVYIEWMFEQTMKAVDFFNKQEHFEKLFSAGYDIKECISSGDLEIAHNLLNNFEVDPVLKILKKV